MPIINILLQKIFKNSKIAHFENWQRSKLKLIDFMKTN